MAADQEDPTLTTALRAARNVVVLTGAGISAESGIPTFRDALTGLWSRYRPEPLASPEAWLRNPKLVWDWYAARREAVVAAQPNAGHLALVELERRVPEFTLITQNVDDLHRRAGSRSVIELHGNLLRVRCSSDGTTYTSWGRTDDVPTCPSCSALLRPDVVWFGEALPEHAIERALAAAAAADLFISVGTSGVVEPAASLPILALQNGAAVVEINPDQTPLSPAVRWHLTGSAGQILPQLVAHTWPGSPSR